VGAELNHVDTRRWMDGWTYMHRDRRTWRR